MYAAFVWLMIIPEIYFNNKLYKCTPTLAALSNFIRAMKDNEIVVNISMLHAPFAVVQ